MEEEGYKVTLNVYDLSQGLARQLSSTFLGKAIEGIWHTGLVVYGNEYYFGGGIQHSPVGATPYGTPLRVVDLGVTHVPKELFEEYLEDIRSRYTAEKYSLLRHNCNNFSNEVAQFLVGTGIPDYILQLPNEVLNSPMGPLILPMIQQLETTLRAGAVPQVPQFRPQVPQFRPTSLTQPPQSMSATINMNTTASTTRETKTSAGVGSGPVQSDGPVDTVNKAPSSGDSKAPNTERTKEASEKAAGSVAADPLGDARTKIQEEITNEFAALMATGEMRSGEAAALATRRVMQRYGHLNGTVQQT